MVRLRGQDEEALAGKDDSVAGRAGWAIDRDMLDLHRADGERVLFAQQTKQ